MTLGARASGLVLAAICVIGPSWQAVAQSTAADAAKCPARPGASIAGIAITSAVSNPRPDVICTYTDGSIASFQVDKGCDVEPTGIIADAIGPGGGGFVAGRHECHESGPGAAACHIVCPRK